MNDSVQAQLQKILDEYAGEASRVISDSFSGVAAETMQRVKDTSPKDSGGYAGDWTMTKPSKRAKGVLLRRVSITIYNKRHYRLTHLLEKGHVVRNQFGTYGRAPAHPHIEPAEEWGERKLLEELQSKL